MDLENMLSEISPSEKDKYHLILLMWNLMNKLNNKENGTCLIDREQEDS